MDFQFGEQHSAIRESVREFRESYCDARRMQKLAGSHEFPEDLYDELARSGILKTSLTKALGGDEAGLTGAALVAQELSRASSTLTNMYLVNAIFAGGLIGIAGTDGQRVRFLPAVGSGKPDWRLP